ncbi:MAG: heavy metal translocating P-type ATPase [Alphaproteobacteria bacterium]
MKQCLHCGLDVPSDAATDEFCCFGCEAAWHLIRDSGLDSYYKKRILDPAQRPLRPDEEASIEAAPFITKTADGEHTLHLLVEGLQCAACVWLIETLLGRSPGVKRAHVNMTSRRLEMVWDPAQTDAETLMGVVRRVGYGVYPYDPAQLEARNRQQQRRLLRAMAVAGFAAANVMILSVAVWSGAGDGGGSGEGPLTRSLFHWFSALIALPAIAYAGRPFFRSGLKALLLGRTNMDVPISLAIVLTAGVSLWETVTGGEHVYFESAVMLLFFLLLGRTLDRRARGRAEAQAERLGSLVASSVTVIDSDGKRRIVAISRVEPQMTVLVAAGERAPVDGIVCDGVSDLDCSLITGEALPVAVAPGTTVHAGTLNLTAALRITVEAVGADTLLADISRLMESAERSRGRFVDLAERVSRLYAPLVHLTAVAAFIGWTLWGGMDWQPALLIAVAVLIITCPCALALAVPVVQVMAVSRLMRRGVLVTSASALERLAGADTVVFDKTGTLTKTRLSLEDGGFTDDDLKSAAAMAATSSHPLARALVRAFEDSHGPVTPISGVTEHPGNGLAARQVRLGRSQWAAPDAGAGDAGPALWLSRPGRQPVRFGFYEQPRDDAATVVDTLKSSGRGVCLLSGDGEAAVARIAAETGITNFESGLRPDDKVHRLNELTADGRRVLMVGDGLNDAPALAAAYVSASPSGAADITRTAADIIYQGDRMTPLLDALDVARRAQTLVRQNIGFALLYNGVAIPLAIAGWVTPLVAAVSMSASSIIVIMNALRLRD